jgi:hypothetical protein
MSSDFWMWFVRKICSMQRITLPNVGTFSIVFAKKKSIQIISTRKILVANQDDGEWTETVPDVNRTTIHRKVYIRFRPTGNLKLSIKELLQNASHQPIRCYTGDSNPVISSIRWGKYIAKTQNISNLSQHRRLIWWYHQDKKISIPAAAQRVGSQLQMMGNQIANTGFANLGNGMSLQIVEGKKNVWNSSPNPNRWRIRFTVPQEHIIESISNLDIQ